MPFIYLSINEKILSVSLNKGKRTGACLFFPGHYARVESAGSGESYSTPRQLPAETFEVVKTNALDETELWPQIFSEFVLSLIFSQ